ncbi:hypothetical protein SCARD494_07264 [Seiridium cardinale]
MIEPIMAAMLTSRTVSADMKFDAPRRIKHTRAGKSLRERDGEQDAGPDAHCVLESMDIQERASSSKDKTTPPKPAALHMMPTRGQYEMQPPMPKRTPWVAMSCETVVQKELMAIIRENYEQVALCIPASLTGMEATYSNNYRVTNCFDSPTSCQEEPRILASIGGWQSELLFGCSRLYIAILGQEYDVAGGLVLASPSSIGS